MFIREVSIAWDEIAADSYLRDISALKDVERIAFTRPVTFFVGGNGSGKSTLLEAMAIAEGFNPEGGTRNYSFSTYDSHSELCEAVTLVHDIKPRYGYFLRAESFYNVATMEEEYSKDRKQGPLYLHRRSHGEGFLTLIHHNFSDNGVFFLDEPESALSPSGQLSLLLAIDAHARKGAQFFIATHSPILLALSEAQILEFSAGPVHETAYEDTESYKLTSLFINEREGILKKLLDEQE